MVVLNLIFPYGLDTSVLLLIMMLVSVLLVFFFLCYLPFLFFMIMAELKTYVVVKVNQSTLQNRLNKVAHVQL